MAESFFPQLGVGAVAQYPLRKTRTYRTIKNVLADGRLILLPDRTARRVQWELSYYNLTLDDIQALQNHFRLCQGALKSFTFLDPTGNLFTHSDDLRSAAWQQNFQIRVDPLIDDPFAKQAAFRLTNDGQAQADLYQPVQSPANYMYCLSAYVRSFAGSEITLFTRGELTNETNHFRCGPSWTRVSFGGRLEDRGPAIDAGLALLPGQQIDIFGLQMEPQRAASGYKPTANRSGVYAGARYAMNELLVTADAPNMFSTTIVVESAE